MFDPKLSVFMMTHGRLPRITDEIKPWAYYGWALPYIQEIHRVHPAVSDRWGYLLRIHETGRLPREPIPPLTFDRPDSSVTTQIKKGIEIVSQGGSLGLGWRSFRLLIDWIGWALGVNRTAPDVPEDVHEQLYRFINFGPWLLHPWDYLGEHAAVNHAAGWNPNAFYPTPHPVCEAMVQMQIGNPPGVDQRTMTVCDPAMGTGRLLLHAASYCLFLYGQDIDGLVLAIAKINGALYAPWLNLPPPKHLEHKGSVKLAPMPPAAPRRRARKGGGSKTPPPPPPPRTKP